MLLLNFEAIRVEAFSYLFALGVSKNYNPGIAISSAQKKIYV
jgi:hypothetical protein